MRQNDSDFVAEPFIEIQRRPQPGGWGGGFMPAQQRARKENCIRKFNWFGFEQHFEIRGELVAFTLEKILFPKAAWAAMVVVTRDGKHWDFNVADGAAGCRDRGFGGAG